MEAFVDLPGKVVVTKAGHLLESKNNEKVVGAVKAGRLREPGCKKSFNCM